MYDEVDVVYIRDGVEYSGFEDEIEVIQAKDLLSE